MGGGTTGTEIASAGMRVQSARIRVMMENLANADTTASTPGGDPYRRKHVVFQPIGAAAKPQVRIAANTSAFPARNQPDHPAADAAGLVKMPNVSAVAETTELRAAIGAYEKNMDVIAAFGRIEDATLALLKA